MAGKRGYGWWAAGGAVATVLVALLAAGCGGGHSVWENRPGPKVVVSFAPLYCFATNVAGDDAGVKNMMTTTGPHDFNPTDTDARLVAKADLFLINGLDLDTAKAEAIRKNSGNAGLKVIDLGGRLPADKLLEGACHHDHGHAHADDHDHGTDPHVWLSPEFAVLMTEAIRDELKAADPAHATNYDRRAAEYTAKLRKLKDDGLAALKDKQDRKLVTFHESLAYFARDFNLSIEGVVQKKPGVEPNSDELKSLIAMCRKNKVRLIAVEPQYSTETSAKAILGELTRKDAVPDAALVRIDPLETVDAAALTPDWYERKMRENIDALAKAMK